MENKVVLITGAARRIGRVIAKHLHQQNWQVVLHCRKSVSEATDLATQLNQQYDNSATVCRADLSNLEAVKTLAEQAVAWHGRLDALVNNASAFFPTPIADIDEAQWNLFMDTNAKAPLFLARYVWDALKTQRGSIVNIADIHADRPLKHYPLYALSKATLAMLTRVLA